MDPKNQINIKLTHLDNLTKNTLSYFLQSNLCKCGKLTDSLDETHLFIVDYYQIHGSKFLSSLKSSNKHAIILHVEDSIPELGEKILLMKKPIDTIKLINLIEKTYRSIKGKEKETQSSNTKVVVKEEVLNDSQHNHLFNAINEENKLDIHQRFKAQKFVGSNKDIDAKKTIPSNIFFTEDKYLYYYLERATKLAQSKQLNIILRTSFGDITYLIKEKIFIHNFDANKLKLVQTSPLSTNIIIKYIDKNISLFTNQQKEVDKTEFIWESAIQASKGRLPKGTDLNKTVKMKTWPNFSKLQIFRYSVQISAVWSRNNLSLIETATQLNIPQRYVFTLFCAMNSLNYALIDESSKTFNTTIENKSKNTSLFSKILTHMFGK